MSIFSAKIFDFAGNSGSVSIAIGSFDVGTGRVSDATCNFGENSALYISRLGFFDVATARVSDAMCDFGGEYRPYSYRDWVLDVDTARVPDAMCYFGRNSGPIDIAIGISRRFGRSSFGRHVLFWSKIALYSYRDWYFRHRDHPSSRRHVRFLSKFGPYSYRDWDVPTSRPPEFPTPCASLGEIRAP